MSPDSAGLDRYSPSLPSLLMDLRPCYEGFAGIPQETRLLFALFSALPLARFGGLASGIHYTSRRGPVSTPVQRLFEQTKVLISQDTSRVRWPGGLDRLLPTALRRIAFKPMLALSEVLRSEKLDLQIDVAAFEDYLWTKLFDNTLPPSDRVILNRADFFATELGHEYARALSLLPRPFQRRLKSRGWDVFFASTVSPYRVPRGTAMMIRYYDALPLLSPHTIGEPWPHANGHVRMLQRNMDDGASFYCDSEPVRGDLLNMFPAAESRVHTIPVTVAPEFRAEPGSEQELRTILARRKNRASWGAGTHGGSAAQAAGGGASAEPDRGSLGKIFLAVSTLEPRKNYLKLFRAFEMARRMTKEPMQLVVVANAGWRSQAELDALRLMVGDGTHHLSGVPTAELRVLYSMAHCVVAPSRAEGFDYSGAESMACGTPVIASDIPVHRWVYGDAAAYFDPYDAEELGRLMARLAELPKEEGQLGEMRDRGLRRAMLYRPETLAPRWEAAIEQHAARAMAD